MEQSYTISHGINGVLPLYKLYKNLISKSIVVIYSRFHTLYIFHHAKAGVSRIHLVASTSDPAQRPNHQIYEIRKRRKKRLKKAQLLRNSQQSVANR